MSKEKECKTEEITDDYDEILNDIIVIDDEDDDSLMHGACPPSARCQGGTTGS